MEAIHGILYIGNYTLYAVYWKLYTVTVHCKPYTTVYSVHCRLCTKQWSKYCQFIWSLEIRCDSVRGTVCGVANIWGGYGKYSSLEIYGGVWEILNILKGYKEVRRRDIFSRFVSTQKGLFAPGLPVNGSLLLNSNCGLVNCLFGL